MNRPITCASTLAAALTDYYDAAESSSDNAEHDAAVELARCAEWLLDTRAVRIADYFACAGLRARALALRTRTAAAAAVRLPQRVPTLTSRSLL
ncbi:hypothetical protein [Nocardia sp. NPDC059691]|uniref:hypothetical protein n=1 Tax=Nocardia sp. NPDC059691 TaxID=3346908 RepID=UPI0036840FED